MDVDAFLKRIGFEGSPAVNLESLRQLQRAFLLTVPFENLDIHFDEKPALSFTAFYDKIVTEHRGGLSYECNGLLFAMLRALGFDVQLLSARFCVGDELTDDFEHMLLWVALGEEGDFLVDVGLGLCCPEPIQLNTQTEYVSEGCAYRLGEHQAAHALFYQLQDSDWQPRYVFTLEPRALVDFASKYRFHQSSDQSPFTQGQLVTRMTETGRVTLNGMTLSVTDDGKRNAHELVSEAEYLACLKQHFGIELEPQS